MAGLSFAAALVGAKKPSAKDAVATADISVATPSSSSSSENIGAVPSAPPTAPAPRKNAWSVPVAAAPATEKIADSKVTRAASDPAAIKLEGTSDQPSVSKASQSDETATATSTAKRRESKDENQNKVDGEKKSAWKKPDADAKSRAKDDSCQEERRSTPAEQQNENKSGSNAGKHKSKKNVVSSAHDGKQKKQNGNKPKQQKGAAQTPHHQQKGKKGKQNAAFKKGGEKSGNQNANNGSKSKKKPAKSNNHKKKNNKAQKQRKNMYSLPPPLSATELEQLKGAAVYQVEYFFSDDELCRNTFLRRNMDCEGYVPAAMIFNFPSVAAYCFQYYDLLAILAEKSTFLEIDQINETLRRRDDYKKWLHPNGEGGFGCPRWIKQVRDGKQNESIGETSTAKSNEIVADAAEADDASSGGSNVTPDTDSCTDSENLEQVDPLEQGQGNAAIVA